MAGTLLLAARYMAFHRGRTAILIAAIALTMGLPLAMRWTISQFQQRALQRAYSTPLVVGTKGSRFGLAIHALYFRGESPTPTTQAEVRRIEATGLAQVIPIHASFRAQGYSIVGSTDAYIKYRGLVIDQGRPLERLGDCLVGATVARKLGIKPGQRLLSEPENLFDLSGPSPLNLRVTGILRSTGTPDDESVVCDLKTTWIIQGIGHGHQLKKSDSSESNSDASAPHDAGRENLVQYAEVTDENLSSFHFHGKSDNFPVTAIIAIPYSEKSETLLIGQYLGSDQHHQIIRPVEVVNELISVVGQIRQLFDLAASVLAITTLLLVVLVLLLSVRLRQPEMRTMFLLGCSRSVQAQILLTELTIVVGLSLCLAVILSIAVASMSDRLIHILAGS